MTPERIPSRPAADRGPTPTHLMTERLPAPGALNRILNNPSQLFDGVRELLRMKSTISPEHATELRTRLAELAVQLPLEEIGHLPAIDGTPRPETCFRAYAPQAVAGTMDAASNKNVRLLMQLMEKFDVFSQEGDRKSRPVSFSRDEAEKIVYEGGMLSRMPRMKRNALLGTRETRRIEDTDRASYAAQTQHDRCETVLHGATVRRAVDQIIAFWTDALPQMQAQKEAFTTFLKRDALPVVTEKQGAIRAQAEKVVPITEPTQRALGLGENRVTMIELARAYYATVAKSGEIDAQRIGLGTRVVRDIEALKAASNPGEVTVAISPELLKVWREMGYFPGAEVPSQIDTTKLHPDMYWTGERF